MKGITVMYDHRGKIWGAIIAFLAFIAMIAERFSGVTFLGKLNSNQTLGLFEWLMLAGLFFIVFSKEKNNEEKAQQIRLKAFQIAFGVSNSVILGMALCASFSSKLVIGSSELFSMAAVGILLYLIFFHFGLYFDTLWEKQNIGLMENIRNIKKNKIGILAYFVLSAIFMGLLLLLMLF